MVAGRSTKVEPGALKLPLPNRVAYGPELIAVSMGPGLVHAKPGTVVGFFNVKWGGRPQSPLPNTI